MSNTRLLEEIREANLSYILLAQQLIREDRPEAIIRLGINEDVADILEKLSTAQVLKIASGTTLMCKFRFDDAMVWNLLTNNTKDKAVTGMHAAILMASKAVEVAA